MATTTRLFRRNGHFLLRVILPLHHPLLLTGKSLTVKSFATSSPNEAEVRALESRLKILHKLDACVHWSVARQPFDVSTPKTHAMREIFERWKHSHPRSNDRIGSCDRALKLFETLVGNVAVEHVNRAMCIQHKTYLLQLDATHKTARDRLIWVKSSRTYTHIDHLLPELASRHSYQFLI